MDDSFNNSINPNGDEKPDITSHVPVQSSSNIENPDSNPEDLDSRWLRWKCLNCGYLYEGAKELKVCPRCGNDNPDMFEDAD
ncbi:MAG: hypothetical protein RBT33_01620 [Candidatus Dojkabacteria bacterium]|jgi:rubrerythrin|nr:hypothetical protein [Candidatus Dojkabacteria bacterium]